MKIIAHKNLKYEKNMGYNFIFLRLCIYLFLKFIIFTHVDITNKICVNKKVKNHKQHNIIHAILLKISIRYKHFKI